MTTPMRRKLSPAPLPAKDPSVPSRPLAASSGRSFALPTVAALLMLGAVACSTRANGDTDVSADLPQRHAIASSTSSPTTAQTTVTTAPTTGGTSLVPPIDPDPHLVKGESAIVVPTPPTTTPKKPLPPTVPSSKPPKLGGAVAITETTT
jgi:hypothetical protein